MLRVRSPSPAPRLNHRTGRFSGRSYGSNPMRRNKSWKRRSSGRLFHFGLTFRKVIFGVLFFKPTGQPGIRVLAPAQCVINQADLVFAQHNKQPNTKASSQISSSRALRIGMRVARRFRTLLPQSGWQTRTLTNVKSRDRHYSRYRGAVCSGIPRSSHY